MDMDVSARGSKILIEKTGGQDLLESEAQIFPEDLPTQGMLSKVIDIGSKVDIDIEEGEFIIINKESGMPIQDWIQGKRMRLVDQSHVYGVLNLGKDKILSLKDGQFTQG